MSQKLIIDREKTERIYLTSNYTGVEDEFSSYYGGDQKWFGNESGYELIKKTGCGLIAMSDISLYLRRAEGRVARTDYLSFIKQFNDSFVHLRMRKGFLGKRFGMNNIDGRTSRILNAYFRKNSLPYKAVTRHSPDSRRDLQIAVTERKSYKMITDSIKNDLPVIIGIGPSDGSGVPLYTEEKLKRGTFVSGSTTENHYVTITGVLTYRDEYKLTVLYKISSWGKKYYINANDLLEHITREKGIKYIIARISNNMTIIKHK